MVRIINNQFQSQVAQALPSRSRAGGSVRLWGLSPIELHDAFWRSKGVQCVSWGQPQKLQRAAELFLLIDPEQMVLFDIAPLSDRLTWRDAGVTRLRLVGGGTQEYSEHVMLDDRGVVQRIERRYRPSSEHGSRVMITSMHRIAEAWMAARSRREGWDRVRRLIYWSRVDHVTLPGMIFREGDSSQERQMITELVERWRHPDQAIAGLKEIEPGVWCAVTQNMQPFRKSICIGPLWLGCCGSQPTTCLIGPAWIADQIDGGRAPAAVNLKDIFEVAGQEHVSRRAKTPTAPMVAKTRPSRATAGLYSRIKRAIDIVASVSALAISLPIMTIIAMAILIEDGRPLFFGHLRQGRGGKLFRCWKFRTMRRNAHQMARQLQSENLCDGPQVLIKNDPRVTRLGKFLRAANLDELPQFWNVLKGDMSLVGPRPSPDDENQYCPAWRDLRLSVRPGITGLWQLNRTRAAGNDFQEWIKYDTLYVRNAGLWLDLHIMFRTAVMMLTGGRGKGRDIQ